MTKCSRCGDECGYAGVRIGWPHDEDSDEDGSVCQECWEWLVSEPEDKEAKE